MISKMVITRQKQATALASAIDHFGEKAARRAMAVLAPGADESESTGAVVRTLHRFRDSQTALCRALVIADEAHETTKLRDEAVRRRRDEAAAAMLVLLRRVRDRVNSACGAGIGERLLDLGGTLPRNPSFLHALAQQVIVRLRSGKLTFPPQLFSDEDLDPVMLLNALLTPFEKLDAAVSEHPFVLCQLQASQIKKNEAMQAFDRAYLLASHFLESLLATAGLGDISVRLRRRRSSPARKPRTAEETASAPAAAAAPAPLRLIAPAAGPVAASVQVERPAAGTVAASMQTERPPTAAVGPRWQRQRPPTATAAATFTSKEPQQRPSALDEGANDPQQPLSALVRSRKKPRQPLPPPIRTANDPSQLLQDGEMGKIRRKRQ